MAKSIKQLKIDMHNKMSQMHSFEATKELTSKPEAERHMHAAYAHARAAHMIEHNDRSSRHPHNPMEAEAIAEELSARAMNVNPAEMRNRLFDIQYS